MDLNAREVVNGFIQGVSLPNADEVESSFLEELVAGFDTNPKEARRAMRKLLLHDNTRFFTAACRILRSGPETAGREYLARLLLQGDLLVASLADAKLFPIETAVELAKVFVTVDPLLDFKLMRLLLPDDDAEAAEVNTAQAERVLALVAGLPRHPRIVPLLIKLLRSAEAQLRSRVVLLFCQVSNNPKWAERMLTEDDPAVRASAVESLWGTDTPSARALLREGARDAHELVVAGALVGMYLLDSEAVAAQLEEMVRHPLAHCRAAAAGAMGRARDGHFVPWLNSLVKDPDAVVRGTALRALVSIRKKLLKGNIGARAE
jgi:HEAT repeat protein